MSSDTKLNYGTRLKQKVVLFKGEKNHVSEKQIAATF